MAAVSDLVGGFHGLGLDEKKVMLSVKDVDNDCAYKLVLKETSGGDFIIDSDVDESDVKWTLKADFLCFGRYFNFFDHKLNSSIVLTCSYIMVVECHSKV